MKTWQIKTGLVIFIGAILIAFTQCVPEQGKSKSKLKFTDNLSNDSGFSVASGGSGNSSNTPPSGANGLSSVDAFAQTVHPITRQRCVSCHGSVQQPLHAVASAQQAHDAVINAFKVDLSNPAQSRLVLKLREGHNCWTACTTSANQMQSAVEDWVELMEMDEVVGPGMATGLVTIESETVASELDPNNIGNPGDVILNMGASMLAAPMVKATEDNLDYVWVPNGTHGATLANNDATAGRTFINIPVPLAGTYRVFGLVRGYGNSDDSFHIMINNVRAEWHVGGDTMGYKWVAITNTSARNAITFNLNAQAYQVEIREREDGTKLSKLLFTDDLILQASEITGGGPQATLSFPLNGLAPGSNAEMLVDVSIFDMYSYRFTNPRIKMTSGSLRIKNIKLLINGKWNPQHATYTIVDKVATAGNGSLSTSSLIALKDKGEDQDRISFSFEVLSFIP